ncbi:MAG: cobyrinic acid a,c-diamide synthase [Minwuia thermotolerans]|nr:MAG: cobyrinic acid a,c-diamide synthase [Minwuia thermotolerans]
MSRHLARGLILAAPHSGAGKTSLTAGLLGALGQAGVKVAAAKCGPDYIDPTLHAAVLGQDSVNLDPWAMDTATLRALAARQAADHDLLLVEGVMGLFDGGADGSGSTADLAAALDLPVVLVLDVARQAQSVAALVEGFSRHRGDTRIAGLILNRVGSARHADILKTALKHLDIPILGTVPRQGGIELPSRHLGLVPAAELPDLETRLSLLAGTVSAAVSVADLLALATPLTHPDAPVRMLPPPGQRVAVAQDTAFCFMYPHLLRHWRDAGAEIMPFSPLADQSPDTEADFILLPGGYPELHAGQLAANTCFMDSLRSAARSGKAIYGECGGYMVLGESLTDSDGQAHRMSGLLPVSTSFAARRLHLGYRRLTQAGHLPWPGNLVGHEFHYATILQEGAGTPLFRARDALGHQRDDMGRISGSVSGSFAHLIGPDETG